MINYRKLQGLIAMIRRDGPTNELLKETVITLADQVVALQREIDQLNSIARRADRNSRTGGGLR